MKITDKDLEKYLNKKGYESVAKPASFDIIGDCCADLMSQLDKVETFAKHSELQKLNFLNTAYSEILFQSANAVVQDVLKANVENDDMEAIDTLMDTPTPEDFFNVLGALLGASETLFNNFITYVISAYLGLCNTYMVVANPEILKLQPNLES